MEPELKDTFLSKNNLDQITPLSKYLAMALFVILPFLGGWIGYYYVPEKVVEVEKVVVKETFSKENTVAMVSKTYQNDIGGYSFNVPDGCLALDHNFLGAVVNSDSEYDYTTQKELRDVIFDIKTLEDSQVLLAAKSGQNQYFDQVMRIADFSYRLKGSNAESYYKRMWDEGLGQNADPDTETVVRKIDNINGYRALGVNTTVYSKGTRTVEMYRFSGIVISENRIVIVQIDVPEGRGVDVGSFNVEKPIREVNEVVASFSFN